MDVLGIDFGTSNTVAVLAGGGRPPRSLSIDGSAWMPSAIYVDDDDTLAVGRDAERKARLAPERFEANPKRRIDDGEILLGVRVVPVVDAIAAVLRRVGEEARRQLNGRNPDQVHLTHPAQWGSSRQNILLAAARAAGLGGAISLLPEPVAAAAHFASLPGNRLPPGAALAVYDLGGGTFDCAVVGATPTGYTVLAEAGLADVGGVDFDQTVLDHLGRTTAASDAGRWQSLTRPRSAGDRRAARALREDVRAAKETLSRYSQTDLPMPEPYEDTLLTRREFEGLIRPAIARTIELVSATVSRAGLSPEKLAGIYLVGGSSRIPLVATMITEKLRVVPTTLDQPEASVAMGAALSPGNMRPMGRTEVLGPPSGGNRPLSGRVGATGAPSSGGPTSGPSGTRVPGANSGAAVSGPIPVPIPGLAGVGPGRAGGPVPAVPALAPAARMSTGTLRPAPQGPPMGRGPAGGGGAPATRPSPTGPGMTGPPGHQSPPRRSRLLILGAVGAVVLIAVVTVVIILTTGGSKVAEGGGTGTSSAAGTVPAVPRIPATCETEPIDASDGMTPCLLALAGSVPSRAQLCQQYDKSDADLNQALSNVHPVAVSLCALGVGGGKSAAVIYVQVTSDDDRDTLFAAFASTAEGLTRSWTQGGAAGQSAAGTDSGEPELAWSYAQVPVVAFLVGASTTGQPSGLTADDLAAYWKSTLLPPD